MADDLPAERRAPSRSRRAADAAALRRIFDEPDAGSARATDDAVRAAVVAGFDAISGHRDRGDGHARPVQAAGADDAATVDEPPATTHVEVPATVDAALRRRPDPDADELDADLALASLAVERKGIHPLRALRGSLERGLTEAGEMSYLAASAIGSAVRRPRGYWGETREQIYSALKLCWVPMIVSITAFGIGAPGLQGGNVFSIFGVPEREGSFIVATGIREFAPWIDAMIIAGVVGTAITADIGARRIREEIDAMEVLGVDPLRELVVPRVLSTAIITGLFDIVALLVGILGGYIASVVLLGASTAGYVSQFFSQANVPDLLGSFVKTFIFGAIVGVVCCYKGLRASGGPAGVGRAVNQAVVVSFALIWMVNYVFTNILLGFAPGTQAYH